MSGTRIALSIMINTALEVEEVDEGYAVRIYQMNKPSASVFALEHEDAELEKDAIAAAMIATCEAVIKHLQKKPEGGETGPDEAINMPKPQDVS